MKLASQQRCLLLLMMQVGQLPEPPFAPFVLTLPLIQSKTTREGFLAQPR